MHVEPRPEGRRARLTRLARRFTLRRLALPITMPHALRADPRLNAALLITHFCWRELHDLLVATDDVRDLERVPEGEARAQQVLERALARLPRRPRLMQLVTRRFNLIHERFLNGWHALPEETRRLAARRADPSDFLRRGLNPAALLWAVATDPDPSVREHWPNVVLGCFPEIAAHLELQPPNRGAGDPTA